MHEPIKLRSKVVEIEAMQFVGGAKNATPIINWVLENGGTARYHEQVHGENIDGEYFIPEHIEIDTPEGTMKLEAGSWAFKGLEGEFYPCKDSVKIAKYDEIDDNIVSMEEPS